MSRRFHRVFFCGFGAFALWVCGLTEGRVSGQMFFPSSFESSMNPFGFFDGGVVRETAQMSDVVRRPDPAMEKIVPPQRATISADLELPDPELLRSALQKQLDAWSPEKTLLETVTPAVVLKMTFPFGADTRFLCRTIDGAEKNPPRRTLTEPVYALGVLCWNIPVAGKKILQESSSGIVPKIGTDYQQSRGELLAALAMAEVAESYEIRLDSGEKRVADLVAAEKKALTFSEDHGLVTVGLAFYIRDKGETWTDANGQPTSLTRLAAYELDRPVYWDRPESIHRLLGLTFLSQRFHQEAPRRTSSTAALSPESIALTKRLDDYLATLRTHAYSLRSANGLWETKYLSGEPATDNLEVLLASGHTLRWLILSAPEDELRSESMRRSVYALALLLAKTFKPSSSLGNGSPQEIDALSTSLHAISLYLRRR